MPEFDYYPGETKQSFEGGTGHTSTGGEGKQWSAPQQQMWKKAEDKQRAKDLGYFSKASYINRSLSPTFKGSIMPNKTQDFLKAALDNEDQSMLGFDGHSGLSGKQLTKQSQMLDKLEALGVKDLSGINQLSQSDFETLMPPPNLPTGGEGG